MENRIQALAILRYHAHLQRLGRAGCLDDTARLWVVRFAGLWRSRFQEGRAAA